MMSKKGLEGQLNSLQKITENNTRIDFVDRAKFLGIFLLLIDHIGNYVNLTGASYVYTKLWICSFHMPLFFVAYGYVVKRKDIISFSDFVKFVGSRFGQLVVPYVLWCLINTTNFDWRFWSGITYASNPTLRISGTNATVWFLPAMFLSTIIYQGCITFVEKSNMGSKRFRIVLAILLTGVLGYLLGRVGNRIIYRMPWSVDVAFMGVAFMLIGRFGVKTCIEKIITKRVWNIIALIVLGIIGVVVSIINRPDDGLYAVTIMALSYYGKNVLLFIGGALCSTMAIFLLANLLKTKLFNWMGKSTLIIMSMHGLIFPFSIQACTLLLSAVSGHNNIYCALFALLNAIIVTAIFIPIIWFINRFCPCLNGKKHN